MQPTRPASFGKRGASASRPAAQSRSTPRSALETTSTGVPISELAKTLMAKPSSDEPDHRTSAKGVVPTSWRAGILAGLAASSLQAGYVILQASNSNDQVSAMLAAAGVDQTKTLPILLLSSLIGGGEATASTILFVHSLLRKAGQTNLVAYAVGGGVVAAGVSALMQALGTSFGPTTLPVDIATGVAAGFFYRMFAGARG